MPVKHNKIMQKEGVIFIAEHFLMISINLFLQILIYYIRAAISSLLSDCTF